MKALQRTLGAVILFTGLTGLAGNANAEELFINFMDGGVYRSSLGIYHIDGAAEGYDSYDATFLPAPTPALDIYSKTTIPGHTQLSTDARPSESLSTITSEIDGGGLSIPNNNHLGFSIEDALVDNNFANKNIFADLYDPSHTLLGTYDVKDYAANGKTIPITVNNGLSYTMDVRFTPSPEPSTLALAGTAGLAGLGYAASRALANRRRRKYNLRLEDRRATGRVA